METTPRLAGEAIDGGKLPDWLILAVLRTFGRQVLRRLPEYRFRDMNRREAIACFGDEEHAHAVMEFEYENEIKRLDASRLLLVELEKLGLTPAAQAQVVHELAKASIARLRNRLAASRAQARRAHLKNVMDAP